MYIINCVVYDLYLISTYVYNFDSDLALFMNLHLNIIIKIQKLALKIEVMIVDENGLKNVDRY